jgi:hypothetical protein
MRKIHGVKNLIDYLDSVNYPISEKNLNDLILSKCIPHTSPIRSIIIFDLDHIDWWISEKRKKT